MDAFALFATVAGLALGSFFNVLIWRIPRNESIAFPASHCPSCNHPLTVWENIPLLSYLLLRGRCRGCQSTIPVRYPLTELFTALAALLLWHHYTAPALHASTQWWEWVTIALKSATLLILIPIALIDMAHYIIPDVITLPGLGLGIAVALLPGEPTLVQALMGMVAGGGTLWALGKLGEIIFRKDEAMGGGDIKMMAFAGAFWGWEIALMTIVFASLLGVCTTLPLLVAKKIPQDRQIPFGPFLGAGLWIAVLWGKQLLLGYVTFVESLFF
jgi:leader peptidase (prepilin peptidase)/N-methyltransferase